MAFGGWIHQSPVQICDPLYLRSEIQVRERWRHMLIQILCFLSYLEQPVKVRCDNLRCASLARRNALYQSVLTPKIINFRGGTQPLCDKSVNFILAILKVEEVENLIKWDIRCRLTIHPWPKCGHNF